VGDEFHDLSPFPLSFPLSSSLFPLLTLSLNSIPYPMKYSYEVIRPSGKVELIDTADNSPETLAMLCNCFPSCDIRLVIRA
jgi:hypothetical protein